MSDELKPIDPNALDNVTGGGRSYGTDLANQLGSIADSVKCLTNKTSGFSSNQFLLFAALALANRNNSPWGGYSSTSVYYSSGYRYW